MVVDIRSPLVGRGCNEHQSTGFQRQVKIVEHLLIFQDVFHHVYGKDQVIETCFHISGQVSHCELYIRYPNRIKKPVTVFHLFLFHIHGIDVEVATHVGEEVAILSEPGAGVEDAGTYPTPSPSPEREGRIFNPAFQCFFDVPGAE